MALVVVPVQELKRRSVQRSDGETTMAPTLIALRDDRVVCSITSLRSVATLACAPTLAVGLDPQLLVFAAQVDLPGQGEGIAYTTMSRGLEAALAVQRYEVHEGAVRFAAPVRGQSHDRSIMQHLANSMSLAPLDADKVARKGDVRDEDALAAGARPTFLPAEEGRLAVDAGTVKGAMSKVAGVGGTVLYLAASPAHAARLLAHGMPHEALIGR